MFRWEPERRYHHILCTTIAPFWSTTMEHLLTVIAPFWLSTDEMMHPAIPRGTALCGATLHPPEVKSCRIIWCVVQREPIVENHNCDLLASKDFLVCNLYRIRAFEHFIVHSTKTFSTFYYQIQPRNIK